MITQPYGDKILVFDRDAIVRAALRAYVEHMLGDLDPLGRHESRPIPLVDWKGNAQAGVFFGTDGEGNDNIVAWTETGVVGLAYELGFGPIQQLGLSPSEVTGGPEDVRGAVPGLPPELEPAFQMATSLLECKGPYGETPVSVGFWLNGDRIGGSMFVDPMAEGAHRLVLWGTLRNGRLRHMCGPDHDAWADEMERTVAGPIHVIIDAVTARALQGPTELTPEELATLLPTPPEPEQLLGIQRCLQRAGITWPGSPELPPLPPRGPNPFIREDPTPKP